MYARSPRSEVVNSALDSEMDAPKSSMTGTGRPANSRRCKSNGTAINELARV